MLNGLNIIIIATIDRKTIFRKRRRLMDATGGKGTESIWPNISLNKNFISYLDLTRQRVAQN